MAPCTEGACGGAASRSPRRAGSPRDTSPRDAERMGPVALWCWDLCCRAASGPVSVAGGVTAKVPARDTVGRTPASTGPASGAQRPRARAALLGWVFSTGRGCFEPFAVPVRRLPQRAPGFRAAQRRPDAPSSPTALWPGLTGPVCTTVSLSRRGCRLLASRGRVRPRAPRLRVGVKSPDERAVGPPIRDGGLCWPPAQPGAGGGATVFVRVIVCGREFETDRCVHASGDFGAFRED